MLLLLFAIAVFVAAWWLTGRVRTYALAHGLIDIPNPRSSHKEPTARGGGVAIAVTTMAALVVLGAMGALAWPNAIAMLGGGAIASAIGVVDDRRHVGAIWRLLAHFTAAAWILWWVGGLPPLPPLPIDVVASWPAAALAAVFIAWLINLTNFMDGIDGIASVEVITVCAGGIVLALNVAPASSEWTAALMLVSATAGFLWWNWPPARIFMGDAGSGFLGVMLAALALQAGWVDPRLFWGWLILLGVFIVDASVTLLMRVVRGDRVFEAHRTHAYQHAALRWRSHRPVTIGVALINTMFLLPVALAVAVGLLPGWMGAIISYVPLAFAAMALEAGRPAGTRRGGAPTLIPRR